MNKISILIIGNTMDSIERKNRKQLKFKYINIHYY